MQNTFNILYIYHCKNRKKKNKHPNSQTHYHPLFSTPSPLPFSCVICAFFPSPVFAPQGSHLTSLSFAAISWKFWILKGTLRTTSNNG